MTMSGFTLLEVVLSLALIGLLFGIGIPIYQSIQSRNDLEVAVNTAAQMLRLAQTAAQAVDGDISWGVKFQSGSITLFKGSSYAARDVQFDETFDISPSIIATGTTEIVFSKFSGNPQAAATTTLILAGDTKNIIINAKGIINY